jgi:hypothetical protein
MSNTSSSGGTDGRRPRIACISSEGISCTARIRLGVVGVVPADAPKACELHSHADMCAQQHTAVATLLWLSAFMKIIAARDHQC